MTNYASPASLDELQPNAMPHTDLTPMNVTSDDSSPVFLVGATRSGTTLLRLMLDSHPEISNFGEFEYAVHMIEDDRLPVMADYYRYLDLDRMYRVRSWDIDPKLGYVDLIRSFLQQAGDRAGKPFVGATVHSQFDELPRLWPNARYIHIVRDPRDVARSCIGMGWCGNAYFGTDYWLEPIRRWKKLSETLPPSRRIQVRYEDLICDTRAQLERICEFIGTDYHDQMMSYPENSTYTLPEASLIEQWKRKMPDDDIQNVESVCHPYMPEFGYTPVSKSLDTPSGMRLMQLKTQHRWNRIQRNLKVYGIPRYVTWQIAKQLPYCALKRRILSSKNRYDQVRLK